MILLLSEYTSKAIPFFIRDEINLLVRDHLNYLPKYYMQPDAKIEPNFDISLSDLVQLRYGGIRKLYKELGYQKTNLVFNTMFRKRFFIDKDWNIIKIS